MMTRILELAGLFESKKVQGDSKSVSEGQNDQREKAILLAMNSCKKFSDQLNDENTACLKSAIAKAYDLGFANRN